MTEDTKTQIIKIVKDHFDQFDILKLADYDFNKKAELIFNELPNIYKKMYDSNVLPEGINLDKFMRTVLPRLQQAANEAHMSQVFGGMAGFASFT